MGISGTKLSSVILGQTKKFKRLKSNALKVPKQADTKKGTVYLTHKITISMIFFTLEIFIWVDILQKAFNRTFK